MGTHGFVLVTGLEDSRSVLGRTDEFELPFDVSRRGVGRARHTLKATPPLSRAAVTRGRAALVGALAVCEASFVGRVDLLDFLRRPLSRATTAALLPDVSEDSRERVADQVLTWIDTLGPVISALRPPRPWTKQRRDERRAHRNLVATLAAVGCDDPAGRAAALAAGIQVPIAAGAWCLTLLATRPDLQQLLRDEPDRAVALVWEVLRLYPPTWVLPRIASRDAHVGDVLIPAYTPVLVSPLALGQLSCLVPGPEDGHAPLDELDPGRWRPDGPRPGTWLAFGFGGHACPGRNLGLAELDDLVRWAAGFDLSSSAQPAINADRGLSPEPAEIQVQQRPTVTTGAAGETESPRT